MLNGQPATPKCDVFISYARVDNDLPDIEGAKGWVDYFRATLKKRIAERIGRAEDLRIWMDDQLRGNEPVSEEVLYQVRSAAVLVAVLSRGYLASAWCRHELEEFSNAVQGLPRSNRRVFCVSLADIPFDQRPRPLNDLNVYEFYDKSGRLGDPQPTVDDRLYWQRATKVADAIGDELLELREAASSESDRNASESHGTVFVAEVTEDLDAVRTQVVRFIRQQGFDVLPDSEYQRYPEQVGEYRAAIEKDLKTSRLFVQLLSELPGRRKLGSDVSYPVLQREVARELGLEAIVWRTHDSVGRLEGEGQHRDLLMDGEVIECQLSDLEEELRQRFPRVHRPESEPTREPIVRISAHHLDKDFATQVGSLVEGRCVWDAGDDLEWPNVFEIGYDGIAILFGRSDAAWARTQLRECYKHMFRSSVRTPVIALLKGPPPKKGDQLRFGGRSIHVIDLSEKLDQAALSNFLAHLKGAST